MTSWPRYARTDFDLMRISQMEGLKAKVDSQDAVGCPQNVQSAIEALVSLFVKHNEYVCTTNRTDQLREFYLNYVETAAGKSRERERLPQPLLKFVLGYGTQVANACKRPMVDNQLVQEAVGAEHFEWLEKKPGDDSALSAFLSPAADLLLPSGQFKVQLETNAGHILSHSKSTCRRTLEPVYRQIIMPSAFLYNSGLSYQDDELNARLQLHTKVNDLVIERGNRPLMSAIHSFKTKESELTKVKKKVLMKGLLQMLMDASSARKMSLQFSRGIRSLAGEGDQAAKFQLDELNESDKVVVATRLLARLASASLGLAQ